MSLNEIAVISQYQKRLDQIIEKRKMIECELGPSKFVQNLVNKIQLEDFLAVKSEAPEAPDESEKVYSDDMVDACQTICKICQMLVTLNYMRTHTKSSHGISVKDYKAAYGNHREQIVRKVYHKWCPKEFQTFPPQNSYMREILSHTKQH